MADPNLTVNLDANAEPLLDVLANIDQNAQSASKSLENIEAAGELAVEGIEKVTDGVTASNGKLDNLNATAADTADHRANSGKTERPMNWASALDGLADFRESDESGNKLLQQCGQSDTEQR